MSAKWLAAEGLEPTVFERAERVGGIWTYDESRLADLAGLDGFGGVSCTLRSTCIPTGTPTSTSWWPARRARHAAAGTEMRVPFLEYLDEIADLIGARPRDERRLQDAVVSATQYR